MNAEALHARWSADHGEHEHVVFAVEGMHCAGCARAIDKAVRALPGVQEVSVNVATARVAVDWLGRADISLTRILQAVTHAGFRPSPLAGEQAAADFTRERRAALKRVGLASLGMMQAMMYLAALYGTSDIDDAMTQLMRIAGMIITTPVLFYSGAPFLLRCLARAAQSPPGDGRASGAGPGSGLRAQCAQHLSRAGRSLFRLRGHVRVFPVARAFR